MLRRYPLLLHGLALALLIVFAPLRIANAYSGVGVTPALPDDPGSHDLRAGHGVVTYDTGTLTFPTGTYTARGEADDIRGVLKAFASSTQTQGAIGTDPLVAVASSSVMGNLRVVGPGVSEVPFTILMDFEGSFSGEHVFNNLQGIMTAGIGNNVLQSALNFTYNEYEGLKVSPESSKLTGRGSVTSDEPFPDGAPIIFSTAPDNLHGQLRLPLMVTPGELISVSTFLAAASGAGVTDEGTYEGTFDGIVDGFSTARISFSLPAGYSFIDDDNGSVLSGATVITSNVPEPSAYAMMFAGLLAIDAITKRRYKYKKRNLHFSGSTDRSIL